ncbi:PAS domain S-box protein [Solimonas variicoloris]|uniref:PAS domain S-box protein n=1 Tax=Solimonas variicoloris TaxID=254408 RepID=UPI000381F964|nr:PAS domain S-box protein [Solimonas variicoloris]
MSNDSNPQLRVPRRRILLTVLPMAILLALGTALLAAADARAREQLLRERVMLQVKSATAVPRARLQGPAEAAHLLGEYVSASGVLDDAPGAEARLGQLFIELLGWSGRYDQVRWIDEHGRERIRAEKDGASGVLVAREQLQDKSSRYYFNEGMRLPRGAIYESPLDLNVENGRVQLPYKPTIRIVSAVFDRNGRRRGIVVVNYLAAELLERLDRMLRGVPGEVQVLNADGQWLWHPDPARSWGFMFGRDDGLGRRDPDLWMAIRAQPAGQLQRRDGLWTWATASFGTLTGEAATGDVPTVVLLMHNPAPELAALRRKNVPLLAAAAMLVFLGFAALGRRLVRTDVTREHAELRAGALRAEAEAERVLRRSEAQRLDAESSLRREQERSREAAERSSREWRTLAESMPLLVWTCDASGACDYLSRQWLDYTGVALEPQLGQGWQAQVHPDDRAALQGAWNAALIAHAALDIEFRLRRHDGVYRWFKTRALPLLDAQERIVKWYGSSTDIDALKRSERALRDSERRFRTIYDATPVSIWEEDWSEVAARIAALRAEGVTDIAAHLRAHPEHALAMLQGVKVLDVNERTPEMFGAPDKATMLRSLEKVFSGPGMMQGFIAEVGAMAAGKAVFSTEMRVSTVDGRPIDVLLAMAFPSPGSGPRTVFISVIDITEKQRIAAELAVHQQRLEELVGQRTRELREANGALQQARDRLQESETRFRSTYEAAAIGLALVGLDGHFMQVNPSLCQLLGYSEAELQQRTFGDITHPDDLGADLALLDELVRGKRQNYHLEKRYMRKDGAVIWAMLAASKVDGPDGVPRYFIAQVHDITERKQAAQALLDRERFLRTITDALPGMIGYWDAELRCRFANAAYRLWFGRQPEELIGVRIQDLLGEKLFRANEPYVRAALAGEVQRFERTLVRSDGSVGYTWAHYIPDVDGDHVRGFYVLVTDVTELKKAQLALERANDALTERSRQAEAATQAKSRFVATMSHEIRTPLNAVLGLLQLLDETTLDARQQDYLRKIRGASTALLNILNDILDYSKIEAGRLALEDAPFALDHLLESVLDLFSLSAEAKGIELTVQVGEGVPRMLRGDALRLTQILNNLVGNALKFTEHGEIRVAVERVAPSGPGAELRFSVEDTGIGMSAEQQAQLFEAFSQGDSSTTRRYGGSGLGLAISKGLVEMMRGRFEVRSELGHGSRFSFVVPLPAAPAAPSREARFSGARALVIDDHPTSRKILAELLSGWGIEAATAASADEAWRAFDAAAGSGRPFNLALIDGRLPDIDGSELVVKLQHTIDAGVLPPLRLLLMASDAETSAALDGTVAKLSKPVTPSRLFNALAGLEDRLWPLRSAPQSAAQALRERLAGRSGARILLVEDNPINQQVADELLRRLGFTADIAGNGVEAVARTAAQAYDLVLMDVQMPQMDGLEACRRIRARECGARMPIVAMTAAALDEDRDAARAAGMDDHLAKPIELVALAEVLRRWIPERVAMPQAQAGAGSPARDPEPSPACVDHVAALARLGGDRVLYAQLLRRFAADGEAAIAALHGAFARQDPAALVGQLHSLRGSAAAVGAQGLADAAADLETRASALSAAELDGFAARMRTVCAAIRQALPTPDGTPAAAHMTAALPALLAEIGERLRRHRAVPAVRIGAVLEACAGTALQPAAETLARALESFDYDQAQAGLEALLEELP